MPKLNATIGLTDNITIPLRNMANAAAEVSANMANIAGASQKLDSSKVTSMQRAAQSLDKSVSELESETTKAAAAQEKHNKSMDEGTGTSGKLSSGFKSLAGTVAQVAAGYLSWQAASKAIDLSDELSQTTSRLNLINDGMQTTEELQKSIFEAAQNSRGSYQDMADTVGRLGTNARDAFSSNAEMVQFAEQLNKQFVLAGANADEMSAATLQLTQGLASGVLRGDELNSVFEQAPTVIQTIAESLGVGTGEIREMATEGLITADVVKNALLGATDETNAKFEQMNYTFGQVWTNFKNQALMAFQPVLESLNNIANNPELLASLSRVGGVIEGLGPAIAEVVDQFATIAPVALDAVISSFQWIVNNAGIVAMGLTGIAAGMTAVKIANQIDNAGGVVDFLTKMAGPLQSLIALINPMTLLIGAITGIAAAAVYMAATGTQISDVADLFANFQSGVSTAAEAVKNGINGMAETIAASFPEFAAQVGSLIPAIAGEILKTAIQLTGTGAQIAISLLNGLMTALPALVSGGIALITNVITGAASMLPELANQAFVMVEGFLASLAQSLPNVLQKGGETLAAFINGISQSLPQIGQAASDTMVQLAQKFAEHLPVIIQKGAELIGGLVTGLISMAPSLAEAAVSLIGGLASFLIQSLPRIITAGVQIVGALVGGLVQSIPAVIQGIGSVLSTIGNAIAEYGPQVLTAAGQMASNLWDGFVQGISAGWANMTATLTSTFGGVIDFVKNIFGIASPSTVFIGIGGFLMEGLSNGIQSMWNGVSGVISGIGESIKNFLTPDTDYTEAINNTRAQMTALNDEVTAGFAQIQAAAEVAASQTSTVIIAGFTTMAGSVIQITGQMAAGVGSAVLAIPAGIQAAFTLSRETASQQLAIMASETAERTNELAQSTAKQLNALIVAYQTAFAAIEASTTEMMGALSANAIALMAAMAEGIRAVFENLGKSLTSVTAQMGTAVQTGLSEMETAILASIGAFQSAYTGIWETLGAAVLEIIEETTAQILADFVALETGLPNSVQNLTSLLIPVVQGMVSQVKATIGVLPGDFHSTALSMMTNLKAGIQSRTQSVVDATSELVQKIKTAFEEGLGIHSPSHYTHWVGEMAIEGLIQGLSDSKLGSFIDSVIEDMKTSFEAGKFNADELVNYLNDDVIMNLVGKVSGVDTTEIQQAASAIVYPLIGTMGTQTSWFGYRPPEDTGGIGTTNHGGADLAAPEGTPIAAAIGGTVTTAGWYGGYGNAVVIDSGGGMEVVYGHMSSVGTSVGATVAAGQQIGLVGSTGNSTGPHLHFEMRQNGTQIDPQPYLEGAGLPAGVGMPQNPLAAAIMAAYNRKHGIGGGISGNVGTWRGEASAEAIAPYIVQALQITGQDPSLLDGLMFAALNESGYNPNAINDWDSNAAAGTPSKGLFQTIDPTFNAYKLPGHDDIWNPLDNAIAAIRYMIDRYGSVANVINPRLGGWYGYARGTDSATPGLHWVGEKGPELLEFRGGERVYPHEKSVALAQEASALQSMADNYRNRPAGGTAASNSHGAAALSDSVNENPFNRISSSRAGDTQTLSKNEYVQIANELNRNQWFLGGTQNRPDYSRRRAGGTAENNLKVRVEALFPEGGPVRFAGGQLPQARERIGAGNAQYFSKAQTSTVNEFTRVANGLENLSNRYQYIGGDRVSSVDRSTSVANGLESLSNYYQYGTQNRVNAVSETIHAANGTRYPYGERNRHSSFSESNSVVNDTRESLSALNQYIADNRVNSVSESTRVANTMAGGGLGDYFQFIGGRQTNSLSESIQNVENGGDAYTAGGFLTDTTLNQAGDSYFTAGSEFFSMYGNPAGAAVTETPADTGAFGAEIKLAGDSFVDTDSYGPAGAQTSGERTINIPIEFHMNPTIHTTEEFDMTTDEMGRRMARAVREALANTAEGLY